MLLLCDRGLRAGRWIDSRMETWEVAQMKGRDGLCCILSTGSRGLRRGRTSGGWHGRRHDGGIEVRVVGSHAWDRQVVVLKVVRMRMTTTVRTTMTTVTVEFLV